MFFITAVDFWIERLEEHMQKIIAESFGIPFLVKSSKTKVTAEWLILDLFKIHGEVIPLPESFPQLSKNTPVSNVEIAEKIELASYKMQFGNKQIQFDLWWKDVIVGQHDVLLDKIDKFFNPESTAIGLTQFKLLLVFRLQQKCLALREAAYSRLVESDKNVAKEGSEKEQKRDPGDGLEHDVEKLQISNKQCSDKILLDEVEGSLKEIGLLMQKLEKKSALKMNQLTLTPSDRRTGELLHEFGRTIREIYQFFDEVDKNSILRPGQDQALLDCSPKRIVKQNDPLLIVYENIVPYLVSNYSRLANFDRLSQNAAQSGLILGAMSSLLNLVTQPIKTVGDQLTVWTYDPVVAEQKRTLLSTTIFALRKSLKDQSIVDTQNCLNEGVWDNCDRTLVAQADEAVKTQGYSIWPQQLTFFFDQTRQNLKDARASLSQSKQPISINATCSLST